MSFALTYRSVAVIVPVLSCACSHAALVGFDALPAATRFGTPTHVSGDLVHTEDGVSVRVRTFQFIPSGSTMNFATVQNPTGPWWSSKFLSVNNINLEFDFTAIAAPVTTVTISYTDFGGFENLGVNGSALYRGEIGAAPSSLGGANIAVVLPTSSIAGRITITGAIQNVTVGGQEFAIDNVLAVPSPTCTSLIGVAGLASVRRRR